MPSSRLTNLVDAIVDCINNADASHWSDLKIGSGETDFGVALPALDPITMFESQRDGVYVLPVTLGYSSTQGRAGRIVGIGVAPAIAIATLYHFKERDTQNEMDVSTWPIIKKVLNLREEIDLLVLSTDFGYNIREITAETAQEIPLKTRVFLSITEIEYDGQTCSISN